MTHVNTPMELEDIRKRRLDEHDVVKRDFSVQGVNVSKGLKLTSVASAPPESMSSDQFDPRALKFEKLDSEHVKLTDVEKELRQLSSAYAQAMATYENIRKSNEAQVCSSAVCGRSFGSEGGLGVRRGFLSWVGDWWGVIGG